jgi:excinuclease ABC subunit B
LTTSNLTDYLQANPASLTGPFPAFIDHMLAKINDTIARGDRCLILTLTKKSSEEVTNYMLSKGYKSFYLHSEVDTIDRREIIKKLKTGQIDVLVGVNLLREGIDLPEVGFIAILDADKEGFLRSTTALVQNIGRAARNPNSEVALYADYMTESMVKALRETYRRRNIQIEHNSKHGITPSIAISNVKNLEDVRTDAELVPQDFHLFTKGKVKKLKRMTKKEKEMIASDLKKQLDAAIGEWRFEDAAIIRDQLKELVGDEGL